MLVLLGLTALLIGGGVLGFSHRDWNWEWLLAILPWCPIPTFLWFFWKAYNRYYQEQLHLYEKRYRFELWLNQLHCDD
jgi:hypothetical protein